MIKRMTKKKMLWLLNMRPELPSAIFSEEERKRYSDTIDKWLEWCKGRVFYEVGDNVVITNDFDGENGKGRSAHLIGRRATITNTTYTHPMMSRPGPGLDDPFPLRKAFVGSEMDAWEGRVPDGRFIPNGLLILDEYQITCSDGSGGAWWSGRSLKPWGVNKRKGKKNG